MKTDTPTPRTDEWETYCDECYYHLWRLRRKTERGFNDGFHINNGDEAKGLCDLLNNLESELTAAREELNESQKDYKCLAELLDGHDATECRMNLVRLKEQRDRLAEALEEITMYGDPMSDQIATEALQSLNQPEPESKDPHRFVIMPDDIDMDDPFFKRLNKTINLNKWQPIETAPKDGTQIMGCDGLNYFICSWGEESLVGSQFKNHGWVTDYDDDGMCFNLESPTHWMPIVPFQQVIQSLNQPTEP